MNPNNRRALEAHSPELLSDLEAQADSGRFEIRKTASGGEIIVSTEDPQAFSLFDVERPERRALAEVVAFDVEEGEEVLCLGYGQGYHLVELLDQLGRRGSLAVVILDLEALKLVLKIADHAALISNPNFRPIWGDVGEISQQLPAAIQGAARVFYHDPSLKMAAPELSNLVQSIERMRLERTNDGFHRRIVRENYRRNLPWIVSASGIDQLNGKLEGLPCIVVAAGPSLDRNAEQLRAIKGRIPIFVVDTAARKICSIGISPDIVIISDPKRASLEHFTDIDTELPLAFLPSASWQVLNYHRGPKWVAYPHADPFAKAMQDHLPRGQVWIAGTVSYFALELARTMGASPVIFVGLDLALTDGRSHYSTARSAPAGSERIWVDGIDGKAVETTPTLDRFRRAIEARIEIDKDARFIDATEGGARIRGAEIMPLEQALAPYLNLKPLPNPFAGTPTTKAGVIPNSVTELWRNFFGEDIGPRAQEQG